MTLKELQKKNETIRKRRAELLAQTIVEEVEPVKEEVVESEVEKEKDIQIADDITEQPKKKGKKPAAREYMVVENIEENN